MTATLNGLALLRARIEEPRVGIWTADVEVDSDADITGTATIDLDGETFVGTVFRGGLDSGRWVGRIVGGAGGMATTVPPRYYLFALARRAIDDIMTSSLETLDATNSDAAALGSTLHRWHRREGTAYSALEMLMASAGVDLRVQRDGTWLLASSAFLAVDAEHELVDVRPAAGVRVIAPVGPPVAEPGITFDGIAVDYVATTVTGSAIRQELWAPRGA